MEINDLANNLGKELVKGILGEIKVNDPSMTPEKAWERIKALNPTRNRNLYLDLANKYGYSKNYNQNYSEMTGFLKTLSIDKLIQIVDDFEKEYRNIQEIKINHPPDHIPGGLSSGKTLYDIAKHHKVDVKQLRSQLRKGIKVELEHTSDKSIAKEIAMDHLYEDPKYYDKLDKMEKGECNEIKINTPRKFFPGEFLRATVGGENYILPLSRDKNLFYKEIDGEPNYLIDDEERTGQHFYVKEKDLKRISEIKINNPNQKVEYKIDIHDTPSTSYVKESIISFGGEIIDIQSHGNEGAEIWFEIHPSKIPELNKAWRNFDIEKVKDLIEIKVNNPIFQFPIQITPENWEEISNKLDKLGYTWMEGHKVNEWNPFEEFAESKFELRLWDRNKKKVAIASINEATKSFTDRLLEEFNKGVEEIKINNPIITWEEIWDFIGKNNIGSYIKEYSEILVDNGYKGGNPRDFLKNLSPPGKAKILKDFQDLVSNKKNLQESKTNPNNFKKYLNYLNEILEYCCKDLNIDKPQVTIINHDRYSQENKSFGGYQPGQNKIYLVIKGRNLSDCARTLCHEIYHHYQFEKGVLTPESGKDGSIHENECNEYSGRMMRHFNRTYPEILTLTPEGEYDEENQIKSNKFREEYKKYVLKELFEKDLPNIKKINSIEYLVGNGKDIEAKYFFKREEPETDTWSINWSFTENNKNKTPEAWKQVTATSYKILKQFIDEKHPKIISFSGNSPEKTKIYKSNSFLEKLKNIFNNQYSVNIEEFGVKMNLISESAKQGIKKRVETLNESYDQALFYWQNLDINSKSKIGRWDAIKRKVTREVLREIYKIND